MSKTFGVLVPVYNEEKTLSKVIQKLDTLNFIDQIIVVDDGSEDDSLTLARTFISKKVKVLHLSENKGKTSAINFALKFCTTDIVAIQDADLEYDPRDLQKLISLINEGGADVVYGSRFLARENYHSSFSLHYLANKFLTFLNNIFIEHKITDMETCYKVFKRSFLENYEFRSQKFGIEVELTAIFSAMGLRIYEYPISYCGRTYKEGKKVGFVDGIWAVFYIFYFNIIFPRRSEFKDFLSTKWSLLNRSIKSF